MVSASSNTKLWGIMPAAGVGARMKLEIPKQYLQVADKTIIEHSINLMLGVRAMASLTVCLSADDQHFATLGLGQHEGRLQTTLGGATRADSVFNGLMAIQDQAQISDWVLVHDAARPCLTQDAIEHLINSLCEDSVGGILAMKAKDTLKQAFDTAVPESQRLNCIERTLDRAQIWHAQTPQMFRYGLLLDALEFCSKQNFEVTDEASALEHAGHTVKLIEGSSANIKITNPDDQALAEFLLSRR